MGQFVSKGSCKFISGELVMWSVNAEEFQRHSSDISKENIEQLIASIGVVEAYNPIENKYSVKFEGHPTFSVSPACLKPIDPPFCDLHVGNLVFIIDNQPEARKLQHGYGEFRDDMIQCLGLIGYVRGSGRQSVIVTNGKQQWAWNPACLTLLTVDQIEIIEKEIEGSQIQKHDIVRIINDMETLVLLQNEEHGGWSDRIAKCCGCYASVLRICDNGDIVVNVNVQTFRLHSDACMRVIPCEKCSPSKAKDKIFMKAFMAAKEGDMTTLLSLADDPSLSISDPRFLAVACAEDRLNIVEWLLDNGGDVNICDDDGDSPLHIATMRNRPSIVTFLIRKEAQIEVANKKGSTPLHIASKKGFTMIVKVLLSHVKVCDAQDAAGNTPGHLAVNKRHFSIVEDLLNSGHRVHIADNNGINLLHLLTKFGAHELLTLAASKFDLSHYVNNRHPTGSTVMHLACANNHVNCLTILCNIKNIDSNLRDHMGCTPLHLAVVTRSMNCIQYIFQQMPVHLLERMDINMPDKDGETALHLAVKLHIAIQIDDVSSLSKLCRQMLLNVMRDKSNKCNDYEEIALVLVANGASLRMLNDQSESVLEICQSDQILLQKLQEVSKSRSTIEEFAFYNSRHSEQIFSNHQPTSDVQAELESIQQKITCPVCFTDLVHEIFQCGHATCSSCSSKIDKCPICREEVSQRLSIRFL